MNKVQVYFVQRLDPQTYIHTIITYKTSVIKRRQITFNKQHKQKRKKRLVLFFSVIVTTSLLKNRITFYLRENIFFR